MRDLTGEMVGLLCDLDPTAPRPAGKGGLRGRHRARHSIAKSLQARRLIRDCGVEGWVLTEKGAEMKRLIELSETRHATIRDIHKRRQAIAALDPARLP